MKKVIILKGLPASGKSTWAKEQLKKGSYKRINKDDLRAMIDNSKWSRENEKSVIKARNFMIVSFLKDGYNVIVDDTNLAEKHYKNIENLLKEYKNEVGEVKVETKFFDTDVEECLKRDAKRDKPVGKKVILGMYNQFLKKEIKLKEWDNNLPDCIICDIDGTLAYMKNRSPFEWSKVGNDLLVFEVDNLIRNYSDGNKIILLSGRDSICRQETEKWLKDNAVNYDKLYMRAEGDNRKDTVIKEELYNEHVKGKYNVRFVLDDRPCMVRKWKELGLFVFNCNQQDDRIDF